MVSVSFDATFKRALKHTDAAMRGRVLQQILKVTDDPTIGKPMRHERKGTRELYVGSYRLSYAWIEERDEVVLLDLYHKDEQ
ncbi:MAG: type II toxin-antitoxin system RelE family toxin [Candidatus Woesearchaeota archaeon]